MAAVTEMLGIDIGGSGIKGAVVDTGTGGLRDARLRVPTPQPATPERMSGVVADLLAQLGWHGPTGATFPAVIQRGIALTAANVDKSWIGVDVAGLLTTLSGHAVTV